MSTSPHSNRCRGGSNSNINDDEIIEILISDDEASTKRPKKRRKQESTAATPSQSEEGPSISISTTSPKLPDKKKAKTTAKAKGNKTTMSTYQERGAVNKGTKEEPITFDSSDEEDASVSLCLYARLI